MPRQLKCPKCGTVNTIADGARPMCAGCGFGGAPGSVPAPAMAPAAPVWGSPPTPGAWPAPPVGYPGMQPTPPRGLAITAMVLGISGCCLVFLPYISLLSPLVAIAAIVTGAIGLSKAKRGEAGGKGMAMTGLILGIVYFAIVILVVILVVTMGAAIISQICAQQPDHPVCSGGLGAGSPAVSAGPDSLPERAALWLAAVPFPGAFRLSLKLA